MKRALSGRHDQNSTGFGKPILMERQILISSQDLELLLTSFGPETYVSNEEVATNKSIFSFCLRRS